MASNVDDFIAQHGVLGMKWGHHRAGDSSSSSSSENSVRKTKFKDLNPDNPEHAAEIKRRTKRNNLIAGAALATIVGGQYALSAATTHQYNKLVKEAASTPTSVIHESKALHDGSVYALHLLGNGSFG